MVILLKSRQSKAEHIRWLSLSSHLKSPIHFSVVPKVLPTYNKQGQEFVKHRAFILHIISKEDIV